MIPSASIAQLRARAETGDAVAMRELANWYHADTDDEDSAMAWWRRAAEAGDAEAAFSLGSMLEDDDPEVALAWYEKAATEGWTDAKVNAGTLLAEDGVFDRAVEWWTSAAQDGDGDAMYNLGQLADIEGRAEEAEGWWLHAARLGHQDALNDLTAQCEELHEANDPRAASLASLVLATLAEVGVKAPWSIRRSLEQVATA